MKNKGFLFLLFSISFLQESFSQVVSKEKIDSANVFFYHIHPVLAWDDFKGRVTNGFMQANTACKVVPRIVEESKAGWRVEVVVLFDKKKSWKGKRLSDTLLLHEQLHYAITEVYARKLRRALSGQSFSSTVSLVNFLNKALKQIMDEGERYQFRYDRETNHGTLYAKQFWYAKQVPDELATLVEYANPIFFVKRN